MLKVSCSCSIVRLAPEPDLDTVNVQGLRSICFLLSCRPLLFGVFADTECRPRLNTSKVNRAARSALQMRKSKTDSRNHFLAHHVLRRTKVCQPYPLSSLV